MGRVETRGQVVSKNWPPPSNFGAGPNEPSECHDEFEDEGVPLTPPPTRQINVEKKARLLRKLMTGSRALVSVLELAHVRNNGRLRLEAAAELKQAVEEMTIEVGELLAFTEAEPWPTDARPTPNRRVARKGGESTSKWRPVT